MLKLERPRPLSGIIYFVCLCHCDRVHVKSACMASKIHKMPDTKNSLCESVQLFFGTSFCKQQPLSGQSFASWPVSAQAQQACRYQLAGSHRIILHASNVCKQSYVCQRNAQSARILSHATVIVNTFSQSLSFPLFLPAASPDQSSALLP